MPQAAAQRRTGTPASQRLVPVRGAQGEGCGGPDGRSLFRPAAAAAPFYSAPAESIALERSAPPYSMKIQSHILFPFRHGFGAGFAGKGAQQIFKEISSHKMARLFFEGMSMGTRSLHAGLQIRRRADPDLLPARCGAFLKWRACPVLRKACMSERHRL